MLPVTGPVAAGAKDTLTAADVPGVRLSPFDIPLTEKPGPAIVTFETVTLELLVFVNVTTRVLVVPTLTFPKLKLEVLAFRPTTRFGDADPEAPAVPLHPVWLIMAIRTAANRRYAG